jgi:UDP-N-acetylmuramyl pentapeptide phosphotransferase/UDP-N-acetylglucosamine-1-phosphate transferase
VIYLDVLIQNPWLVITFLLFAAACLANAYKIIDNFNGLASILALLPFFTWAFKSIMDSSLR